MAGFSGVVSVLCEIDYAAGTVRQHVVDDNGSPGTWPYAANSDRPREPAVDIEQRARNEIRSW